MRDLTVIEAELRWAAMDLRKAWGETNEVALETIRTREDRLIEEWQAARVTPITA
jgi:hypothetical protein